MPVPLKTSPAGDDYFVYDLSVFVLDTPGNAGVCLSGNLSGVRQLTGSMGRFTPPWFSPSRPSTEVSLFCEGSSLMCRELSGSYRPVSALVTGTVFALAADVAPLHRFVPDECVFSCQGAFLSLCCNNSVVTSHILEKKGSFAVAAARLLW